MSDDNQLPRLLLRRSTVSSVLGATPYAIELTEDEQITGVNVWDDGGLVGLQVVYEDANGAATSSAAILRPGLADSTPPTASIDFDGELLIGISGTRADRQAGGHVTSLNFITTARTIAAIPGASGSTFAIDLASIGLGALSVGFFGETGAKGLSIGLSALIRGPFAIGNPTTLWVDRNTGIGDPAEETQAAPTGTATVGVKRPNATWAAPEVFRVVQSGEELRVVHEDGDDETFTYVGLKRTPDEAPTRMLYRSDRDQRLIEVEPPVGTGELQVFLDSTREIKPKPPVGNNSPDALTWGATFNLPERTGFDDYLFCGHDIFKTNPINLQHSTGLSSNSPTATSAKRQRIFKYPDDDSKDYHTATVESAIRVAPNGSTFVPRQLGEEPKVTHSVASEREYRDAWTQSVGAKAGAAFQGGPNASFSANEEFRGAVTNGVSGTFGTTVSVATQMTHVHVLDKALAKLDPTFVGRVGEILAALEKNQPPGISNFLTAFGTHFANAVTFGGLYFMERRFTKAGILRKLEAGISVEAEASVGFGPFTAGASAKETEDHSASVKRNSDEETDVVRTVGGELSVPGGFHLAGKPVPIMMDLRPITDLLNPVMFPIADRSLLSRLRDEIALTIFQEADRSERFNSESKLPASIFEIEIFDVLALHAHLSVLDRLEISISTTGPATPIANSHPTGPSVVVNGPLKNTITPLGLGTLEDLVVQTKDRFYISQSRVTSEGRLFVALPESKMDLRLTVRGKWIRPEDHDIVNLLLLNEESTGTLPDGDINSGAATLRYEQFAAEDNFATFRVARARGDIQVRIGYRRVGLPIAQASANSAGR